MTQNQQHGFALTDVLLWPDSAQAAHVCLYYLLVGGGQSLICDSITRRRQQRSGRIGFVWDPHSNHICCL